MKSEKKNNIEISVVVTCYNEKDNIKPLVKELTEVLKPLSRSYEIIYVDDGSTDDTPDVIRGLFGEYPELRLLCHETNYGQSAGLLSAFDNLRGDIIVTLDADLQNDPHDIPRLLEELKTGDLVIGIRKKRKDTFIRRLSTKIANSVRDFFLKDGIKDAGCAMRAYKKSVLKQLIPFKGLHRFLPTICIIHGFKVKQIPVNHRPRLHGVAKYGVWNRIFVGIHDMLAIHWYRKRHIPIEKKWKMDN
jgi:glycosyltransferase involved in cell wall biosynthesis